MLHVRGVVRVFQSVQVLIPGEAASPDRRSNKWLSQTRYFSLQLEFNQPRVHEARCLCNQIHFLSELLPES